MKSEARQQHDILVFAGIAMALFLSYWIARRIPWGNYDVQPWISFIKQPLVFNIPAFILILIGGSKAVKFLMREAEAQALKERQKEAAWLAKRSEQNKEDSKKFRPIL